MHSVACNLQARRKKRRKIMAPLTVDINSVTIANCHRSPLGDRVCLPALHTTSLTRYSWSCATEQYYNWAKAIVLPNKSQWESERQRTMTLWASQVTVNKFTPMWTLGLWVSQRKRLGYCRREIDCTCAKSYEAKNTIIYFKGFW